jgi:hypothetical protein
MSHISFGIFSLAINVVYPGLMFLKFEPLSDCLVGFDERCLIH